MIAPLALTQQPAVISSDIQTQLTRSSANAAKPHASGIIMEMYYGNVILNHILLVHIVHIVLTVTVDMAV